MTIDVIIFDFQLKINSVKKEKNTNKVADQKSMDYLEIGFNRTNRKYKNTVQIFFVIKIKFMIHSQKKN